MRQQVFLHYDGMMAGVARSTDAGALSLSLFRVVYVTCVVVAAAERRPARHLFGRRDIKWKKNTLWRGFPSVGQLIM